MEEINTAMCDVCDGTYETVETIRVPVAGRNSQTVTCCNDCKKDLIDQYFTAIEEDD